MKREVLFIAAAAILFAGAAGAADNGTVKSLSDLNGGVKDYVYIYPHAGFDALPPNAYTNVPAVHQAPQAMPFPIQADVPIDRAGATHGVDGGVTATDATHPR
jgi:hypothetical protein